MTAIPKPTIALALLMVLALLAASSPTLPAYAAAPGMQPIPGDSVVPPPGARDAALAESPSAELYAIDPALSYVSYHSAQFKPINNGVNWAYNWWNGVLYLASTEVAGEFLVQLQLPEGVQLREMTYIFHDNHATGDLIMGICRIAIGYSMWGCAEKTVLSNGVNTTALLERTLTGSPIYTIENAKYSYYLVAVVNQASPALGIVAARVGYASGSFMPMIQR